MSNSNTKQKMFKVLSSAFIDNPQIHLQQSDRICAGFYATTFSIPLKREFSFAQFNDAISTLTENKFSIEADSLFQIEDNVYRCVLSATAESRPYTEENVKELKLHPVRANIFMDEDNEVVWKLEGEGETKRLVQDSKQDYGALLEAKRSRTPIVASDDILMPYQEHDYAFFFNQELLAMDFGYVVNRGNQDYVFSRSSNKLVPVVAATQVVIANQPEAIKSPEAKKHEMVVSNAFNIEGYLAYLRQMYGSDNPYYKAMEQAIREHAIR